TEVNNILNEAEESDNSLEYNKENRRSKRVKTLTTNQEFDNKKNQDLENDNSFEIRQRPQRSLYLQNTKNISKKNILKENPKNPKNELK
ncbi:13392_t:CDS:2, partial [Cetraspora pellucida]